MKKKKKFKPHLLSPLEFWRIYFGHAVSVVSGHRILKPSSPLLAIHEVFGRLIRNCTVKISKKRINIEYQGCDYIHNNCPSACDAHMGAILGVFEMAHKKQFNIKRETKQAICRIIIESSHD